MSQHLCWWKVGGRSLISKVSYKRVVENQVITAPCRNGDTEVHLSLELPEPSTIPERGDQGRQGRLHLPHMWVLICRASKPRSGSQAPQPCTRKGEMPLVPEKEKVRENLRS